MFNRITRSLGKLIQRDRSWC